MTVNAERRISALYATVPTKRAHRHAQHAIAELVGMLRPHSALSTNPSLHRDLRVRTIHSSLAIEGNTLSEDAVTAILDGKRVLGPERDIREVKNARNAYSLLPELNPHSVNDLLRAHLTMMDGLAADAGRFRADNVGVYREGRRIHTGTPARYLHTVITDLFSWLQNTTEHSLLTSCIFHYEFEFIHPFSDGNGRMGRMWQTLILARWRDMLQWLPVESLIAQRRDEYYERFITSRNEGSNTPFVEFMLEIIADALQPFANPPDPAAERARHTLAFFRSDPTATVRELAAHLGCSVATAERTVKQLREEGALVRRGSARKGRWEVLS